jgi:hypothetical protein
VSCKEYTSEIVDAARSGAPLSPALSHHLALCPRCAERREAEMELSRGMRQARTAVARLRSGEGARASLLAEFDERQRRLRLRRRFVWATAALAALFAAGVWKGGNRAEKSIGPAVETAQVMAEDLMAENEFLPVPYAPPLAPGEYVEVVQAELTPAALARMGFSIQTTSAGEVTTDLMVGEDGVPRAVRVPESVGIRF